MSWQGKLLITAAILALIGLGTYWYMVHYSKFDLYVPMYASNCAGCHGEDLRGTERGVALIDNYLKGGDTIAGLMQSIRRGHSELGTPAFKDTLTDVEVKGLAMYVGERRLGQRLMDFGFDVDLKIPATVQSSDEHRFRIEPLVEGLAHLSFSIEPLPDGSWLVTEKEHGLAIVSPDGAKSKRVEGTPKTGGSLNVGGVHFGVGWLLGVAKHPDYAQNGWIYLHYTELCDDCSMILPTSMNKLDRGRIVDGKWVDVETIWQAPSEFYMSTPDTMAGGRIAFDDAGHVYISVGIKEVEELADIGITAQDLNIPYGKIH
ncbi:MAG: PQQ-dependent sugar dehydrogenase, partial [Pseudomonadota bacterium]